MISRAERSPFAGWWWTVDRWLLAALAGLMVLGIVLTMAGSPPVAERLGLSTFHFVHRQALFLIPSLVLLLSTSFLSPRYIRRAALIVYLAAMAMVIATLFFGVEVKGARRWIFGIQPSEFVKPAFVILAAWAFSEGAKRRDVPANLMALLLLPATIVPLILQPDFGQTMLISLVWAALFFMAGLHWFWVAGIGGLGMGGAVAAYKFVPHVRARILKFIEPSASASVGDRFQVDTAFDSFISGGWFGRGPGEGVVKRILPDSHTDFIFAVTAEEFGIVACIGLVLLFGFIVLRALLFAARNADPF
jgi:cell division protein FtsW